MESASPEQPSEQPPGHVANFVGIVIATMTLTLPLYAISNFNTAEVSAPQRSSFSFIKAQEWHRAWQIELKNECAKR